MMQATKKSLVLIDGSSYLYRAFHALPPLTNSQGEPTGAIYGVINMIRKLLSDYNPAYIGVVFDPKSKTFRNELYPAYKAHRPKIPDELAAQVQPLFEIIRAMGIPLIIVEGVEADDVIATLAMQALKQNLHILISTGDKDLAQLVNDNITLVNTMTNIILDRQGVINRFGIPPERIVDYLALIGDSSDNIPGVPKVGPKTAVKWLQEYGTLDRIIECADKISGKIGENLRNSLALLPLSRQLLTLKMDVPLSVTIEQLIPNSTDAKTLIDLFKRFEFKNWLNEALNANQNLTQHAQDYHTILTEADFAEWLARLEKADAFAFDTETNSLDSMSAELVGLSFSIQAGEAAYVPVAHSYLGAPEQLTRQAVLHALQPLLNDPNKTMIGQNLKYDLNVLANHGVSVNTKFFDTMLESYVLDSVSSRHDMDSLALKHLGRNTVKFEDIAGKGSKQLTFDKIPLEQAAHYAAEDADVTLQLHQALWPRIEADKATQAVLTQIELPLMPILAKIERNGVMIDVPKLNEQSRRLTQRISELEEQAYRLAGTVFNLASPKQLQEIFYDQLKLPVLSKTPTGAPSTAEAVLQELALDYPLPKIILEHRGLSKLKSTYTDSLPKQINPRTGRVHTSYNQAVTSTGRLSSTDPNLQNIPIRNEEGRRIRQAFIAPPGYKIISADYSQVELRIMAHLSQDVGLLNAFAQDLDIHQATAAEIFNLDLNNITAEQRRRAKAINFGLIYGMSAFGLAKQIGVERGLAQQYIDLYFARYPGVHHYMQNIRKLAHKQGYVETLFGRRLYIPEINSSNLQRRNGAERAAINAPMQGTAAEIIKLAMINLDNWLKQTQLDAKMIMQVHDELVFEVAEQHVEAIIPEIKTRMVDAMKLAVPLAVHISVGDNWDEAH